MLVIWEKNNNKNTAESLLELYTMQKIVIERKYLKYSQINVAFPFTNLPKMKQKVDVHLYIYKVLNFLILIL